MVVQSIVSTDIEITYIFVYFEIRKRIIKKLKGEMKMNWFWLWSLWLCGWWGGNLTAGTDKIGWKIFIGVVTAIVYFLLIFKIGTMVTII